MPQPEVLVDYYRSLVERSEGFEILEQQQPCSDRQSSEPAVVQKSDPAADHSSDLKG